jgi:hypothetical protein
MEEPIRQEGFLVSQQTTAPGTLAFYLTRDEAEDAARRLVSSAIPVLVIPAVRFTTRQMERDGR